MSGLTDHRPRVVAGFSWEAALSDSWLTMRQSRPMSMGTRAGGAFQQIAAPQQQKTPAHGRSSKQSQRSRLEFSVELA